jgi:DNA-binding transcriptional MerR regulator
MSDQLLTIGELAGRTGLAPSALRYYEEVGLLPPPQRISGQRRYHPSAMEHVGTILFLRDVGFTLAETKALLTSRSAAPDAWRNLAYHKLTEVDRQIEQATVARVALQHALRCKRDHIFDCPNFGSLVMARLDGKSLEEAHTH